MSTRQERSPENNNYESCVTSGEKPVSDIIKQAQQVIDEHEVRRWQDFVEAMNA